MVHLVGHLLAVGAAGAAGLPIRVAVAAAVSNRRDRRDWSFRAVASDLVPAGAGIARAARDLRLEEDSRRYSLVTQAKSPVI